MFGYVTPLKRELKIKDFEKWRCYYCGLCCQIKKQSGNIPRLSLNYDMAFLAMLLDSLNPEKLKTKKYRCVLRSPFHQKTIIAENKPLSYAAYINISLFYYKLVDDFNDDHSLKSKIYSQVLKPYRKKFPENIKKVDSEIHSCLKKLNTLEKNKNFSSLDEICDPFAQLLGKVVKLYPYELKDDSSDLRNILYNLGYALGKWIYLIDALDDLEKDMEKDKFNPINFLYNTKNLPYREFFPVIKEKLEFSLLSCGYSINNSLDKLNLVRNDEFLFNVIQLGLMDKYMKVMINAEDYDKKNKNSKMNKKNGLIIEDAEDLD